MHRAEDWESIFIETFWRGLEQGAPFVIGFLAAVWLLGRISCWLIQRQPEFSLKNEMRRGTWQVPAAITAIVGFVVVVQWIGVQYTEYPLSFMVAGSCGMAVLALLAGWLLPEGAVPGHIAAFHVATARLRHKEIQWSEYLTKVRRHRQSRGQRILLVVTGVFVVAIPVFLVTNYALPADQMFAEMRQLSRLEERVTDRLQNPLITVVVVGGPPLVDERKVIIRVKKEASEQQIEEVRDQARQVMGELEPEHDWEILVAREREDDHRPSRSPPHPRN